MPHNSPEVTPEIGLRQNFSEPLSASLHALEDRISIELDEVTACARQALSEELNQAMRRLRSCGSTEQVATWLVDSSAPAFCAQAALFEVIGANLRGVRERGFACDGHAFELLDVRLEQAPALASAARERDPVVAIGSAGEVSPAILSALGQDPGAKVHLFPVVIQDKTVAILYAAAYGRRPNGAAALELLTHAAASAVQLLAPKEPAAVRAVPEGTVPSAEALIAIQGIDMRAHAHAPAPDVGHEALAAKARWFARVEVARIRLFHRQALERGRVGRNIYSALKGPIDAARRTYRADFLAVSPRIADYLDRELIGLTHDDAKLLGPEYPGSLV